MYLIGNVTYRICIIGNVTEPGFWLGGGKSFARILTIAPQKKLTFDPLKSNFCLIIS